jgi:hypothetical protein
MSVLVVVYPDGRSETIELDKLSQKTEKIVEQSEKVNAALNSLYKKGYTLIASNVVIVFQGMYS